MFCYLAIILVSVQVAAVGQDLNQWKKSVSSNNSLDERLTSSWELFKYYRTLNLDSALLYAQINSDASILLRDTLAIVKSYNALGYIFQEKASYSEAILNYKKGLELASEKDIRRQKRFLLNNLALVYTYAGNYDTSLKYHFQSLELREQDNDLQGTAVALNNIGVVYYEIGDFEKALRYYKQAQQLIEKHNLKSGDENNLINIALTFSGLGDHESALKIFSDVLKSCQSKSCDDQTLIKIYSGFGISLYKIKNYSQAEINIQKSLNLALSLGENLYTITAYYYLAKIKFENDQIEASLGLLNNLDAILAGSDTQKWQMRIDNLFADIYEAQGNFEKAYFHENKYSSLKDSIFNEELIKNLANIQLDYQEAQTQEIIAGKDTQIKRRTQINLMLGGITLLISALLYILYRNVQLKKKANKKLAEANEIIEDQNKELTNVNAVLEDRVKERTKELKKTNEALKKSNEELDNFIYKTSHDIRGPLATLMGVCNIAQIDVKDDKALDYFDKLSLTATRLNEILSKLLTINQINNTALQPQKIYIAELVENLAAEQIMSYKNPKVEIDIDIADNLNLTSDLDLLRVIYGNLINNAIKFRDTSDRKDSFIKIVAYKNANSIGFEIIDNGIGINETETEKIFEVFSKATDIADSSGIGLYLVKLAVEKLSGTITFDQTDEGFTLFKVVLPA